MSKPRVLIIDPDNRSVQSLRDQLVASGFEVNWTQNNPEPTFLKEPGVPQLVIVNDKAPGMDGFALIRTIRRDSQLPIVVTSTSDDVEARIAGLDSGADDYLGKNVEPRELVARIHSILRRSGTRTARAGDFEAREWTFNGLVVQSNRRRVTLDGATVELTTAEFDLLRLFVSNSQTVLSRELILDQLRGLEWESVDRSIDILVSRLRDKLRDDPRKPRFIRTIRSVGYQFIAEPQSIR